MNSQKGSNKGKDYFYFCNVICKCESFFHVCRDIHSANFIHFVSQFTVFKAGESRMEIKAQLSLLIYRLQLLDVQINISLVKIFSSFLFFFYKSSLRRRKKS